MPAVSVKGVSKSYKIFPNSRDRLKEALSFGRKRYSHDFYALQDIDLEVEPGATMGILGRNGAGKSTLLSIVAGILQPTSGTVEVHGRLVALFALGAGFNPEFTGRENVLLNGLILGIGRDEMLEHFDDIAAFADVGEFMDQPIKTYSSGMRSRLGFAVAINVRPDVLILDETLAAGDAVYKQAALQKMYELRDSGTTILFVSHSMRSVEDFCTEAALLHEGRLLATGETVEVIDQYQDLVSGIKAQKKQQGADGGQTLEPAAVLDDNGRSPQDRDLVSGARTPRKRQQTDGGLPQARGVVPGKEGAPENRTFEEDPDFERRVAHLRNGTGEARIRGVNLLDQRLRPTKAVTSGSIATVRVYLEYLEAVKDSEFVIALHEEARLERTERSESQFYGPNLGYVLELYDSYKEDPKRVDEQTLEFFETWGPPQLEINEFAPVLTGEQLSASTALERVPLGEMKKGERVILDFTFEVPPRKGRYSISAGARAGGQDSYLDKIDVVTSFRIKRPQNEVRLPMEIKVHASEGNGRIDPLK